MVFGQGSRLPEADANMPSDGEKTLFNIKDISTKSVVLYSDRAHVTRETNNFKLRPGANEVEIYGLSPTVDEHSIQIEGRGNATIADLTVQLVPNREIFDDIYPEDSGSSEDDESDDKGGSDSEDDQDGIRKVEIQALKLQISQAEENQISANERLAALDRYARSATVEYFTVEDIAALLDRYEQDRAKIYQIHSKATKELDRLTKLVKKKEKAREIACKERNKLKEKAKKQRAKEKKRREMKKAEKEKEAQYLRQERLRYWPKKVYKITLLLENALETPASSRRSSLDSVTLASYSAAKPSDPEKASIDPTAPQTTVSLMLSYVTKEAGWTPRYDLQISSVNKTATIIYRTEFLNRTSETWKDTKLSFSTSQTSYQGLDDVVPFMHSWRVRLSPHVSGEGALLSPEEMHKPRGGRSGLDTFNRAEMFGLDDQFTRFWQSKHLFQTQQVSNTRGGGLFGGPNNNTASFAGTGDNGNNGQKAVFGQASLLRAATSNHFAQPQPAASNTLFGNTNTGQEQTAATGGLFGQNTANSQQKTSGSLFGTISQNNASQQQQQKTSGGPSGVFGNNNNNNNTQQPDPPSNATTSAFGSRAFGASLFGSRRRDTEQPPEPQDQEAASEEVDDKELSTPLAAFDFSSTTWEDNGLTATYDVPGTRTLTPSSLTRRQKLASLHVPSITLSYICVPKLRSAAFLRVKIRNPSTSTTLLKGSVGVTLDGSFLGSMVLPRVSPKESFSLSLGVDPAIHVNYPKPGTRRSTQGFYNKETAQVFERAVWLNNTKTNKVDVLVIDQVPVSQDERLKIGILRPKGLGKEGDVVSAGVGAEEADMEEGKKKGAWGSATARLKKGGEVNWDVKLEGGKGCLLKLEYEAKLPSSENIMGAL